MIERRRLLQCGLGVLVAGLAGPSSMAQTLPDGPATVAANLQPDLIGDLIDQSQVITAPPRVLSLYNLHTAEKLEAVYWENGTYVPDAVEALNHVLRDYRTGDVAPMNVGLFDLLGELSAKTGSREAFQVVSGYRSPATNALLAERSGEVAKRSLHMDGKAMDIYLEDVALDRLRAAALDIGRGGVGYYPETRFVHVDVGPVRRWQGS
ncbi:DUF882 domain-containing protein [Caulobacter sp. HMWF025]|uniref:DUF882 domain-containing protein n=2 Tax=unclassified Caulobacter TaxID=2648921 RepID=UPI0026B8D96F